VRLGLFILGAIVALGQQRNFVSCPIVRDTKTVPCFLAEYEGETYFLGIQQDITSEFHPPQLKHEVLVEGRIVSGPRVCGGIPLQPVAVSVVKEVNLACNTLLPAEPGIEAPAAPRGPGPSSRRAEPSRPRETFAGAHEFAVGDILRLGQGHPSPMEHACSRNARNDSGGQARIVHRFR